MLARHYLEEQNFKYKPPPKMVHDYSRKVTCLYLLQGVFAWMEEALRVNVALMEKDFIIQPSGLRRTGLLIHQNVIIPAQIFLDEKVRITSPSRRENEEPYVLKVAGEDYPRLKKQIELEVVEPLRRGEGYAEALAAARRILHEIEYIADQLRNEHDAFSRRYSNEGVGQEREEKKFIVSVDLCKYGLISSTIPLDELFKLNQKIQRFIHESIETAGAAPEETLLIQTGDGAIVLFDDVKHALGFSVALAKASKKDNSSISHRAYKRYYRIGICYGWVQYQTYPQEGSRCLNAHLAGTPIAVAVRVQASAEENTTLVQHDVADASTGASLHHRFGQPFPAKVKDHEKELTPVYVRKLLTDEDLGE